MKTETLGVSDILAELVHLQETDPECDLQLFTSLVSANQYRLLYRKIKEHVPRGGYILDWGCGSGHLSYGLEKSGYRVSGYGFANVHLRRYLSSDYQLALGTFADPVSIPYPDGHFDAVASCGVLEHVRETGGEEGASLMEIARILKPKGHFVCYHLPNMFSLTEWLNRHLHRYHHHDYRFTQRSIRDLCHGQGFDLLEIGRYGALPRNAWNRLPGSIRNSSWVASFYNMVDHSLAFPLSALCQNYFFVARKTSEEAST